MKQVMADRNNAVVEQMPLTFAVANILIKLPVLYTLTRRLKEIFAATLP